MLKKLIQRVDRAIWRSAAVRCEECGRPMAAHTAIWHGNHPYCSVAHEIRDTGEIMLSH